MSEEGQLSPGFASAISPTFTSSGPLSLSPHPHHCGQSQESLIRLAQLGVVRFLEDDQCCRMKLRDHTTGNIFRCGALFSEHPRWDRSTTVTTQLQPANSTPSIQHSSVHPSGSGSVAGSSVPSSLLKNLDTPSIHGSDPSQIQISRELIEQANRSMEEVANDDQSIQATLGGLGPNSALDPVAKEEEEAEYDDPIDESYSIVPERAVLLNSPAPRGLSPPPMSEVGGTIPDEMVQDLEVPVHGEYQFLFHLDTQDDKHLAIMDFFRLECQGQSVNTDWVRFNGVKITLGQELPFKIKVVGVNRITLTITHIGGKGDHISAPYQLEIKEILERLILTWNSQPVGKRSNLRFAEEGRTLQIPIDNKPTGALVRLCFKVDEAWIRAYNL